MGGLKSQLEGNSNGQSKAVCEEGVRDGEKLKSELEKWERDVDKRYAWIVLGALWIMMATLLGPYRIYGLIFAKISKEKVYTRQEASWPMTLIYTVENLLGPFVSLICFHISKQSAIMLGAIFVTIGNLACYWTYNLWLDIAFLGVVQGIGFAFIFMPLWEVINEYFVKYRNLAFGVALCGGTMAVFVLAPIAQYLLDNFHWRTIYLATGLFCSLNIPIVVLLKAHPRPNEENEASSGQVQATEADGLSIDLSRSGFRRTLSRYSVRALAYQNSFRGQATILTKRTHCDETGLTRSESIVSTNPFASTAGLERKISRRIVSNNSAGADNSQQQNSQQQGQKQASSNQGTTGFNPQPLDSHQTLAYETISLCEVGRNVEFDIAILKNVFQTPAFHLIWYNECLYFWTYTIFVLILTDYGTDRGCTRKQAQALVDFQSAGEIVGRLLLTFLVDLRYISNRLVTVIVLSTLATLLFSMSLVSGFAAFAVITCIFSASSALLYIMLNALLVDYVGEKQVTLGYGLSSFIGGFIMLFRSFAVGYCRDHLGTYDPLMIGLSVACIFGAILWLCEPLLTKFFRPKNLTNLMAPTQTVTRM